MHLEQLDGQSYKDRNGRPLLTEVVVDNAVSQAQLEAEHSPPSQCMLVSLHDVKESLCILFPQGSTTLPLCLMRGTNSATCTGLALQ